MKYDKPSTKKSVGIIANKVEYLGDNVTIRKIAKEYNNYVDNMIERSKVDVGEQFVKLGERYTITNENTFLTIQSVLQDALLRSSTTAKVELQNFMMSSIGKDKTRDSAITFMNSYPSKISKLTRLLINNGTLELKPGKSNHEGTFEYHINKEQWTNKENQQKVLQFIEKHGINTESIDAMVNRAQKDLEMYLDESYSVGDTKSAITKHQFFNQYLKSIDYSTPAKMDSWLNDRLYDARDNFKGWVAIDNIIKTMEIPAGKEKLAY